MTGFSWLPFRWWWLERRMGRRYTPASPTSTWSCGMKSIFLSQMGASVIRGYSYCYPLHFVLSIQFSISYAEVLDSRGTSILRGRLWDTKYTTLERERMRDPLIPPGEWVMRWLLATQIGIGSTLGYGDNTLPVYIIWMAWPTGVPCQCRPSA